MSDVIYVLLTLAVFIALALLVGLLDRHSGGTSESRPEPAEPPADLAADLAADGGAR